MSTETTRAILLLCSRPDGMRNDIETRDLLGETLGRSFSSGSVSPALKKIQRRGLISSELIGHGLRRAYTITDIGRQYLTGELPAKRLGRPRHAVQTSTQLVNWRKAPLIGDPRKPELPRPVQTAGIGGFDPRYQVNPATFEGGEFSRLGLGRYVEGVA